MGSERVAAVVVTCNRPVLLAECLGALAAQTREVDALILVDNGAADVTRAALASAPLSIAARVTHLPLERNIGGAGGFCAGLERAYREGYDWFWLLDDDAIPEPSALRELLETHRAAPPDSKPVILASRVVWTDGRPLHANEPKVVWPRRALPWRPGIGVNRIRSCAFLSALIHRQVIDRHGYPVADYFVWVDDIEYTSRVLRRELGVSVETSVVCHKVPESAARRPAPPERFYYFVRNYLWMLLHSEALSPAERLVRTGYLAFMLAAYWPARRFELTALAGAARGVRDGLFRRPRTNAALDGYQSASAAPTESPSRIESAIP